LLFMILNLFIKIVFKNVIEILIINSILNKSCILFLMIPDCLSVM
jgi:hypothetical protein